MPSLRDTKNRIKSVKNTEKITRAMKMVAASKLRRAQDAVIKSRPYARKLNGIMSALAQQIEAQESAPHPLLEDRVNKKKVMVIALTSDRGLCGALNSSVVRKTHRFIFDNEESIDEIAVSTVGRKGFEGLARLGIQITENYLPNQKSYDLELAKRIAKEMCQSFLSGEIDGVYLIYNEFKSAISQDVVIEQMLPVQRSSEKKGDTAEYLYEPDRKKLLEVLVSQHFATRLYQSFLESYASEQGARMTAMDNATRNAKDMTEKLTLLYNRARQAAITKELMEIIGGAEAL